MVKGRYFLNGLYVFLRGIVRMTLLWYYREIRNLNFPKPIPDGPLIILSNHPNALLDPLIVVSRLQRQVFFLANAGLFRHPIANFLLNKLYCIPVERPVDVGGPIDNTNNFRRSRAHLGSNGALYIAPEGTSEREYRLRPLKTGTARIIFDAIQEGHVEAVHVMICGIHYSGQPTLRSAVALKWAPILTITADSFNDVEDPREKVRQLTNQLEQTLQGLLPHQEETADQVLLKTTQIFAPALVGRSWLHQLYAWKQDISQADITISAALLEQIQSLINKYDVDVIDPTVTTYRTNTIHIMRGCLSALLIILCHIIPLGLPYLLRKRLRLHPVYDATVEYVSLLLCLPLGYLYIYWLTGFGEMPTPWRVCIAGGLLMTGPLLYRWYQEGRREHATLKIRRAADRDAQWWDRLRLSLAPFCGTE